MLLIGLTQISMRALPKIEKLYKSLLAMTYLEKSDKKGFPSIPIVNFEHQKLSHLLLYICVELIHQKAQVTSSF